jgi:hypothetical protein
LNYPTISQSTNIYNAFSEFRSAADSGQRQYEVIGLAHSRVSGELDLLDEEQLEKAFTSDFALREVIG